MSVSTPLLEPPLTLEGNGLALKVGSIPYDSIEGQVDVRLEHE